MQVVCAKWKKYTQKWMMVNRICASLLHDSTCMFLFFILLHDMLTEWYDQTERKWILGSIVSHACMVSIMHQNIKNQAKSMSWFSYPFKLPRKSLKSRVNIYNLIFLKSKESLNSTTPLVIPAGALCGESRSLRSSRPWKGWKEERQWVLIVFPFRCGETSEI
jgi:hypothetical protein